MSRIVIINNTIIAVKGLMIDYFNGTDHTFFNIQTGDSKQQGSDTVSDIAVSADGQYLAVITSMTKQLIIYELPPTNGKFVKFELPRSASKIRFGANQKQVLIADKSGDALIYNIKEDNGTKILGHLSLLLDILQTNDEKYIITSDRDEKIRVSQYPNTYNIQTYCLGHKEFVNHIELLPHDDKYVISTSGDGLINIWNYTTGKLCYSVDTFLDINEDHLREDFSKVMCSDGVEVNTLPIVHIATTQIDETSSLLAVAVYSFNKLLLYKVQHTNTEFSHLLMDKLDIGKLPSDVKFNQSNLFVYNEANSEVSVFKINYVNKNIKIEEEKTIKMFENQHVDVSLDNNTHDSIKMLFKRKYDNVQEYQERKKQRLGNKNNT